MKEEFVKSTSTATAGKRLPSRSLETKLRRDLGVCLATERLTVGILYEFIAKFKNRSPNSALNIQIKFYRNDCERLLVLSNEGIEP